MDARAADRLVERLEAGGVLYLLHVNADPDCVGSAFALQESWPGVVGAPDGLNRAGAKLAGELGLVVDPWPHPERFQTLVGVDLGSRSSLGRLADRVGDPCLVDHHRYGDLHGAAPARVWDPSRASCCEVVLDLLDRAGRAPSPAAARGLLAGLVADTARFRHADASTLRAAARLLEGSGTRLADVLASLEDEGGEGDALELRRASLLAASRAEVEVVAGHLVATSRVGSFDAAAANALVRAGADLALVGRERGGEARLSLRASRRLLARGLHLGEVANGVARNLGWSGGGHEGAAGLRGEPPVQEAQEAILARVKAFLGES